MEEVSIVGQVIGGKFGDIIIRQKSNSNLEIGDLMVSEEDGSFLILQVFALEYGSQIQDRMQQMMSGVNLEQEVPDARLYEPEFVNYVLARIKPLARVYKKDNRVRIPKTLPAFFNKLRLITYDDLTFLQKGDDQIFVGHIRSGSKVLKEAEVWLPAKEMFSHHMLIPATTGRGKSNLVKTILWHVLDTSKVSALVLDAHDEYFGRDKPGLKDHSDARDSLVYYTPSDPPVGSSLLTINIETIRPEHFEGIVNFSDAQFDAIRIYNKRYKKEWIYEIMTANPSESENKEIRAASLIVVQRKLSVILGLTVEEDGSIRSEHTVFDSESKGKNTVNDIVCNIEQGRVVILDTSRLGDAAELLVGNIIAAEILRRYKNAKSDGSLDQKPVVTIVIEEAPRVIGEDVLASQNDNIYATIAKEGRKFSVGLTAITQLSSVIPKTILANMNTKMILGNEMKYEREAIIASASQDLSEDDKNIASLDRGEAIITSIFVPFAMPIKVPFFDDVVKSRPREEQAGRIKVF